MKRKRRERESSSHYLSIFCSNLSSPTSPPSLLFSFSQSLEAHLSLELQNYNLSLIKTLKIIQKISPQEVASYESEAQETDLEISKTLQEIELLKEELKDEERKRMDKLEYDEISREIEKLDSREKLDE